MPKVPDWARHDWAATLPPFMAELMSATVPEVAAMAWRDTGRPRSPPTLLPAALRRPRLALALSDTVQRLCDATWQQYEMVFADA